MFFVLCSLCFVFFVFSRMKQIGYCSDETKVVPPQINSGSRNHKSNRPCTSAMLTHSYALRHIHHEPDCSGMHTLANSNDTVDTHDRPQDSA